MIAGQKIALGRIHAGRVVTVHVAEHTITIDLGGGDIRTVRRTTNQPVRSIKAHRPPRSGLPLFPRASVKHVPAGHVCTDGRRRDFQVAGNVSCRPPITRQRLGHADQMTALTLPGRGSPFGPDRCDRDSPVPRFGYYVGGAAVPSGGLAVPCGEQALGPMRARPMAGSTEGGARRPGYLRV
jgi:hypothetical protein